MTDPISLDGESLTPEDVVAVARDGREVTVSARARERVRRSRARVEDVLDSGEAVYGLNTGFGELVDERIPGDDLEQLQTNLVRSHAAGAGRELDLEEVRAMMVTRVNALLVGYSGIREVVIDHLVTMLNEGIHPVVRSRGSLGASGDLAPLAHMALVLIGEGEAIVGQGDESDDDGGVGNRLTEPATNEGHRLSGERALETAGLEPLSLAPKEGLALINGTQLTVGLAALAVVDAERLVEIADLAGALTTEVTLATTASSEPAIHGARPHDGQVKTAEYVRRLTRESEVVEAHRNCDRVQDAYSLRCLPQVHGAVRDALSHLREGVETELNSATDNPLVFDAADVDDRASGTDGTGVLSGGNFHGAPLSLRLEYVRIALVDLASISERRMDRLINPNLQEDHLPPFLTPESGLRSGYMIVQYTAAALLNELRSVTSASTDNTPVSGGQEDHVSMSATAALSTRTALSLTKRIVASELVCGVQAAEFVDDAFEGGESYELGVGTGKAVETVRAVVPPLEADRAVHADVDAVVSLLEAGTVSNAVESALRATNGG